MLRATSVADMAIPKSNPLETMAETTASITVIIVVSIFIGLCL